MKKWYVREEQNVTRIWEYEVQAETRAEAIEMVKSGDVECYNHDFDEFSYDTPIRITDVEEIDE